MTGNGLVHGYFPWTAQRYYNLLLQSVLSADQAFLWKLTLVLLRSMAPTFYMHSTLNPL